ncbi:hypothetical protein [Zooshikella harenae]|uniref:Lipo-like protein n=1 Tax=Zooshikella harenae TaxID=2827238 RepID=A0ABS5ZGY0_9GAMM|nr:hypothetical protein [Zooshikella harenae]MBU2713230.1 hypothetical protein [Zooshikella harenae]
MGKILHWLTRWLMRRRSDKGLLLCDFERIRYELKPCDVILIEGRSRIAEVIRRITQSPWSHAAMYIGRLHDIEDANVREQVALNCNCTPDTQLIIESELGLGTVVRPITAYEDDHLRVCRPRGLKYKDAQEVIAYAVSKLGHHYDVRQIVDLARFFLPWGIIPRRWRSSLFAKAPGPTTKTVCSTMIAEAFGRVQFPILPLVKANDESGRVRLFMRNPKLCTPSDFDYSPYFKILKYPFLDYSYHASYRLLPWHGEVLLDDEEADYYLQEHTVVAKTKDIASSSSKKQASTPESSTSTKSKNKTESLNTRSVSPSSNAHQNQSHLKNEVPSSDEQQPHKITRHPGDIYRDE